MLICIGCACSEQESKPQPPTPFSGIAMTMRYRILVGHPLTSGDIESIENLLSATFEEVNAYYNIWNPESELSIANRQPANVWIPLSPQLEHLFRLTDRLVTLTNGHFDPTITAAYQLWTTKLASHSLPSREEIEAIRKSVGWDKIEIGEGRFRKGHANLKIDLGGIAKGYCVDLLTERLIAKGFRNCYVEWGGEIRTSGKHPAQRPWQVYISNLTDSSPQHALAFIALDEEALATSGDYLQQWHSTSNHNEECIFTHIIDPKTLTPVKVAQNNICSATVKAPSCTEADALATAAMLQPSLEMAKIWAKEIESSMPRIKFWLATREEITRQALP